MCHVVVQCHTMNRNSSRSTSVLCPAVLVEDCSTLGYHRHLCELYIDLLHERRPTVEDSLVSLLVRRQPVILPRFAQIVRPLPSFTCYSMMQLAMQNLEEIVNVCCKIPRKIEVPGLFEIPQHRYRFRSFPCNLYIALDNHSTKKSIDCWKKNTQI